MLPARGLEDSRADVSLSIFQNVLFPERTGGVDDFWATT